MRIGVKTYEPSDWLVVRVTAAVPSFVNASFAPGITEPLVSRIVPRIAPVSTCALAPATTTRRAGKIDAHHAESLLRHFIASASYTGGVGCSKRFYGKSKPASTYTSTQNIGQSASLKNAEFLEGFTRGHSALQSLFDGLFAPRLFERSLKNVSLRCPRNNADAIQVTENDIAGFDARTRDFDRHTVVHDLAARVLVLRVGSVRESGEPELHDASGIAGIAVQHRSGGAAMDRARAHQFAP